MSDLGDFKRRVYEPEVAWLKGRISELEQANRSLRADVIELEREAEQAHARADRLEHTANLLARDLEEVESGI